MDFFTDLNMGESRRVLMCDHLPEIAWFSDVQTVSQPLLIRPNLVGVRWQ